MLTDEEALFSTLKARIMQSSGMRDEIKAWVTKNILDDAGTTPDPEAVELWATRTFEHDLGKAIEAYRECVATSLWSPIAMGHPRSPSVQLPYIGTLMTDFIVHTYKIEHPHILREMMRVIPIHPIDFPNVGLIRGNVIEPHWDALERWAQQYDWA